jgi:hypothetical protein
MFKRLLTVVMPLLFFVSGSLQAQLKVGAKVGASMSRYAYSEDFSDYDSKFTPGLTGGIMLEIPFGGRFALQPELLFAQKGSVLKANEINFLATNSPTPWVDGFVFNEYIRGYADFTEKLSYVEVPLLLKYKFRGSKVSSYLAAGVVFSSAVGRGKATVSYTADKNSSSPGLDLKPETVSKFLNDNRYLNEFDFELGSPKDDISTIFPWTIDGDPIQDIIAFPRRHAAMMLYPEALIDARPANRDDVYNGFDLGLAVGGGINIELDDLGFVVIDFRYISGSNTLNVEEDPVYNHRNRSMQLTAGMVFELGGGGWR